MFDNHGNCVILSARISTEMSKSTKPTHSQSITDVFARLTLTGLRIFSIITEEGRYARLTTTGLGMCSVSTEAKVLARLMTTGSGTCVMITGGEEDTRLMTTGV